MCGGQAPWTMATLPILGHPVSLWVHAVHSSSRKWGGPTLHETPERLFSQVPSRGSLEFNPLRLHAVRNWLIAHNLHRTSELTLASGRNANAAIHDDAKCRPAFDSRSRKWLQRCISCVQLGTNKENTRLSLKLQRARVSQMLAIIAAGKIEYTAECEELLQHVVSQMLSS
jgi:hypothetical protein